jgi:hypothetical protein
VCRVVNGSLTEVDSLSIRHVPSVGGIEHTVRIRAATADAEVRHLLFSLKPSAVIVDVVELRASFIPACNTKGGREWRGGVFVVCVCGVGGSIQTNQLSWFQQTAHNRDMSTWYSPTAWMQRQR